MLGGVTRAAGNRGAGGSPSVTQQTSPTNTLSPLRDTPGEAPLQHRRAGGELGSAQLTTFWVKTLGNEAELFAKFVTNY